MFGKKKEPLDSKAVLDAVEKEIYAYLKPLGFRRHGRTLHRFVEGDISQVVNFQTHKCYPGRFWVNLGIRIPECFEETFSSVSETKAFYYEYECNFRSRLGTVSGRKEAQYHLDKPVEKTVRAIRKELEKSVLPVFAVLNSREAYLAHHGEYSCWDAGTPVNDCMIYGRMGELSKAQECFDRCYLERLAEYHRLMKDGEKYYLRKGERIVYMGQDITANKSGYVTLYGADRGRIEQLEKLAAKLGLSIPREETV